MSQPGVPEKPWCQPEHDDAPAEPLPPVVILAADYHAGDFGGLPLWSPDSGQASWRDTKFSAELLDRLWAWQEEFESNYHWESGWASEGARTRWASEAHELAADVRRELGTRASLVVDLWPLKAANP